MTAVGKGYTAMLSDAAKCNKRMSMMEGRAGYVKPRFTTEEKRQYIYAIVKNNPGISTMDIDKALVQRNVSRSTTRSILKQFRLDKKLRRKRKIVNSALSYKWYVEENK